MNAVPDQDAIFRASHVGASEVSALYGCNPYLTEFELFHRKTGAIATPEFNAIHDGSPENERIFWGVRLEAAIIEGAKERYGYTDREQLAHLSNNNGLGGHPDRRVVCPERGPGLLEIKCVDWLVRKGWGEEPPMNYLLQSNTNQGLDGVTWGDVLVLVGGNKLERFKYDFRPKLYTDAEARVAQFWKAVAAGKAPKPDYTRDGDTISALYTPGTDEAIDLQGDNLAAIAAAEWLAADEECKAAAGRRDAARAELAEKLGAAGTAFLNGFIVKSPTVKASPDVTITDKMIGQVLKGRKAHRRFSIKEQA